MSDFSERLRELLADAGISMEQLSEKINVDVTTVRRWNRDAHSTFLSNLVALAGYFNCSLEFLAGRTETKLDYTPQPCPPFYERFRELMKENGITRYRFTRTTRFKDQYFSKWKHGADPHLETLIELSDYFKCTIDYLVGREK